MKRMVSLRCTLTQYVLLKDALEYGEKRLLERADRIRIGFANESVDIKTIKY